MYNTAHEICNVTVHKKLLQLVSNNVLVTLQGAVYYSVLTHLPCDLELAGLAALPSFAKEGGRNPGG